MQLDELKIRELLVALNYVSAEDMDQAINFANSHGTSVKEYLLQEELISKSLLGQALAEAYQAPYVDLEMNPPSPEQVVRLPEDFSRQFRVVVLEASEKRISLATDDPAQAKIKETFEKNFPGKELIISYALPEDIDNCLAAYTKPLNTRFAEIIKANIKIAPNILEEVFTEAFRQHASDIHFEPLPEEIVVRFRIDGILHEAGRLPKAHYDNILNRIKVQSHVRIDEHYAAQDGSMRYEKDGKKIDIRTSIVPTVEGEKIALRILTAYVQSISLSDLGLSERDQHLLELSSRKPFGMILVTGPTGSGKTTTLYAVLKVLSRPELNVTTIEDPVEYKLEGVNQIQVNPQTNLTFAKGLRSIVRQDPDIILVGEIRDEETAEIGVNAALTGHLLLSTFHANDASTAIPRLFEMGIEPFLLSSTLELIVAQRLVRRICPHCRHSINVSLPTLQKSIPGAEKIFAITNTLYEGSGCESCNHTGYKGRVAIFELIRSTPELQDLLLKRPSSQAIWQLAKKQGALSLFEDGLLKVKNGTTTLEELLRVAQIPTELTV